MFLLLCRGNVKCHYTGRLLDGAVLHYIYIYINEDFSIENDDSSLEKMLILPSRNDDSSLEKCLGFGATRGKV